jgi:oligopeptide transport system ATP-binding protein
MKPLLQVKELRIFFSLPHDGWLSGSRRLKAVDGVTFDLAAGRTLGIVGESGCGKSTLVRGILGLTTVSGGSIRLSGEELTQLSKRQLRTHRRQMQVVFQDPFASLDPRMTAGEIIAEPLQAFEPGLDGNARRAKVQRMMERVGLQPRQINRYPHEFSGGQCQRIGIAQALILNPALLICDEPVSALDVSIQAQIINLLMELQQETGVSMLFIAHDLAVVKQISHEVMVMYLGKPVELACRDALFKTPRHPYTRALMEAVPVPDPGIERSKVTAPLGGDLPSPLEPPSGCRFRTRCPRAQPLCAQAEPQVRELAPRHLVACHFPLAGETA